MSFPVSNPWLDSIVFTGHDFFNCAKASGDSEYCFVGGLLETEDRHGLSKKESAWLAGIMLYVCLSNLFLSCYFINLIVFVTTVQQEQKR